MNKLFVLILMVCASISIEAQTAMRDVWLQMPDSLLPYLNKNLRQEQIDFVDMGVKAEVNNLMSGTTIMDTLTTDYTRVALTSSSTLELRLLPVNDSTKIICMVKTFSAPAEESSVAFYDSLWQRMEGSFGLPLEVLTLPMKNADKNVEGEPSVEPYVERPDTMTVERFDSLCKFFDPVMVKISMEAAEPVVSLSLSVALTTKQEREQLKAILKQRRYRWNGGKFVEF